MGFYRDYERLILESAQAPLCPNAQAGPKFSIFCLHWHSEFSGFGLVNVNALQHLGLVLLRKSLITFLVVE